MINKISSGITKKTLQVIFSVMFAALIFHNTASALVYVSATGKCSDPQVHYNCAPSDDHFMYISGEKVDGSTSWTWTCSPRPRTITGIQTIIKAYCSEEKPIIATINVSSNISSSWKITGPATIAGSGTSQTSTSQPAGTYTIIWNTVAGYTTPISQSLTLTVGNTILFEGNYIATGCANNTNASGVRLTQMMSGKNYTPESRKAGDGSKIKADTYCFGNTGGKTYFVPQGTNAEFQSFWNNIESGINPLPGLYKIQ